MLRLGGDKLTDKTSKTVNNPLRENSNPVQFLRKKRQTLEELSHFFESESIFVKTKDDQKQPEINKLISEMEKAGKAGHLFWSNGTLFVGIEQSISI